MLWRHFTSFLLASQLENLRLLTIALLYGASPRINRWSRFLPIETLFRHRQKRLLRFLANPRIEVTSLFVPLLRMVLRLVPLRKQLSVIVDETDLPSNRQALVAAIPWQGRALHFAFTIFQRDSLRDSQNQLENSFFAFLCKLLTVHHLIPVFLLDRGYADVKLIRYLKQLGAHYVIRACQNVYVRLPEHKGTLAGLGRAGSWTGVLYQQHEQELINLRTVWGKDKSGNRELIYLITDLEPDAGLQRYRLRMRIEEGFRDLKHTLGLEQLRLKCDINVRLGRVLFLAALTVIVTAYLYPVVSGYYQQVTRHISELSFVSLAVQVCCAIGLVDRSEFG